ncbi:MAG TPA: hypothetical protein VGI88_07920 [Verrucomicrobiae bacterium]|jgi:hypothetical protein
MGVYFFFTFLSAGLAFVIRRVIKRLIAGWRPTCVFSRQNIFRAILRAFPFAFAFTPYLLMERGLGVLIPAGLFLCLSLPALLFGMVSDGSLPDEKSLHHVTGALLIFMPVWLVLALILFAHQSLTIDKTDDEQQA